MARTTRATNQRPDIEEYLTKRGVEWEFVSELSPARFDKERSLKNQARLGAPLNAGTVKRYSDAVENGDRFPPVLAHEDRGKLLILDGNHRLAAHADAGVPLDAYVCQASPQTLMLLTYEANTKHGLPSSEEDRIHHALFLMDSGLSEKEAATRLSLQRSSLRKAKAQQDSNRRADDAGILRARWEAVPASSRNRLAMILTDEGFKAAVELTLDAALTSEEVSHIVSNLNEVRSGQRQADMVKKVRDGMAARIADVALSGGANRKGKRVSGSPSSRLAMALGQLGALPSPELFRGDVPEQLREDTVKKLDEAAEQIAAIKKALS